MSGEKKYELQRSKDDNKLLYKMIYIVATSRMVDGVLKRTRDKKNARISIAGPELPKHECLEFKSSRCVPRAAVELSAILR